jgi:hypothetical protein
VGEEEGQAAEPEEGIVVGGEGEVERAESPVERTHPHTLLSLTLQPPHPELTNGHPPTHTHNHTYTSHHAHQPEHPPLWHATLGHPHTHPHTIPTTQGPHIVLGAIVIAAVAVAVTVAVAVVTVAVTVAVVGLVATAEYIVVVYH